MFVDDVIGRADRFGFQNFCSPGVWHMTQLLFQKMCSDAEIHAQSVFSDLSEYSVKTDQVPKPS